MARRKKVDTSQLTFDFEVFTAQSEELHQELEEDSVYIPRGDTTRSFTGIADLPRNQLSGLEDTGPLGGELAGGSSRAISGEIRDAQGFRQIDEPTDNRDGHSDKSGGHRADAEWSNGPRTTSTSRHQDRIDGAGGKNGIESAPIAGGDYVITSSDQLGQGGLKVKFKDNIEALRTLQSLKQDNASKATLEDQKRLVKYIGWGAMPQAFDHDNEKWHSEYQELKALLSQSEYEAARRSTQDAHYTSEEIINGIYAGLEQLGFDGPAEMLEPSAGIGHFLGLLPEKWRDNISATAIELDPTTADIGRFLYPDTHFIENGFQNVQIPNGKFDLAIGNPPFGNQHVFDAARKDIDFSIHNYFIAKSINTLRDGGIAAFVVSRYFLDAQDQSARQYISERANLLGAIRLPNTAFKENAGTEVTTDIVFFQKTSTPELNPRWVHTGLIPINIDIEPNFSKSQEPWGFYRLNTKTGDRDSSYNEPFGWGLETEAATLVELLTQSNPEYKYCYEFVSEQDYADNEAEIYDLIVKESSIHINQYFIDNPYQMIGEMSRTQNMYRNSADLLPLSDFAGFPTEICRRLSVLPEGIYQPRLEQEQENTEVSEENLEACRQVKVFSYFMLQDGQIGRRMENVLDEPTYEVHQPANAIATERIKGMIAIRDTLAHLISEEQKADTIDLDLDSIRADLNRLYDGFVKKHGYISSQGNRLAMRDDAQYPLLTALEKKYDPGISAATAKKEDKAQKPPSAEKADILNHRVLGPKKEITHVDTSEEALIVSLNEKGIPDLSYMEWLTDKSQDDIISDLKGRMYLNPAGGQWEIADKYLTGNVKVKLKAAQEAAADNPQFDENVTALMDVQPPDLEPVDISVQFGSTWLPPKVMQDFAVHLFGTDRVLPEINYSPVIGKWAYEIQGWAIDRTLRLDTWGTEKFSADSVFTALLENTQIRVNKPVGRNDKNQIIYKVDEEATAAAQQKGEEMRQAFQDWIWSDPERRDALAALYNERFNADVARHYNGKDLEMPGMSLDITLQPHQKDAIWRGIQDGTALFDHPVGAGKTYVCIGTMMRMQQLGLIKKPMITVPNHLVGQWKDSFHHMYPQANLLVADKRDFQPDNRQAFFSKIATGDWDAVIVPHSSFGKINLPEQELDDIYREQVNELVDAIEYAKQGGGGTRNLVKLMEKERDRLQAQMERKFDSETKDKAVSFADLGVDTLLVDESQAFKNLAIKTSLHGVAGLGNLEGSNKAAHMHMITRYIQRNNNGRGVFHATGTPLSNTLAEMFTLQRYMQYEELQAKGLHYFDAWATTFGDITNGYELDATGMSYKIVQRFAKFQNVPELTHMYRSFADVITREEILANNQGVSLTPKIKGGKPQNIVVQRSELQADYMGQQIPTTNPETGEPALDDEGFPIYKWTPGSIIDRMENLPGDASIDNPLVITSDAKKAALDFRLIDPSAPDYEGSKINVCVDKIFNIWKAWETDRGAQLVFCDMSTPKFNDKQHAETISPDEVIITPEEISYQLKDSRFCVYDDVKAKLIAKGVPENEIRYIHEAKTDIQKSKLFEDVREGRVRVLIGSTEKMGAGTNVQNRLVALHHLDAPWRPSDLEQREGRIIRQGNELFARDPENFEIEIFRYATEQTYDARMWQTIEKKAEGIELFRQGDGVTRIIEDVAGSEAANAAEMKAAASGNELIFTQVQIQSELRKMESIYRNFTRSQHQLESRVARLQTVPEKTVRECERWSQEIALRDKNTTSAGNYFVMNGKIYGESHRQQLANELLSAIKKADLNPTQVFPIGKYRGFDISLQSKSGQRLFRVSGVDTGKSFYQPSNLTYTYQDNFSITGFVQKLDNFMNKFEDFITHAKLKNEKALQEYKIGKENLGKSFNREPLLKALRQDHIEVLRELNLTRKNPKYKSKWKPRSLENGKLKDLKIDKNTIER